MYSVKGVKSFRGREGHGFECSLYKDGKKIGTVTDTARGGEMDFYLDDGEEKILEAYCDTIPKEQYQEKNPITKEQFYEMFPDGRRIDRDTILAGLVDKFETHKRNKRICKTKTMVKVEIDGKTTFYTYPAKFSIPLKTAIKDRDFPDTDVVWMNEVYS